MALSQDELLGFALLLWAAAGLLALYLLCNPGAAALYAWLGPWRSWGIVLGLASLALALPARRVLAWSVLAVPLALVVLPAPPARRIGPAALVGEAVLFGLTSLWRRRRPREAAQRGPDRLGRRVRRIALRSRRGSLAAPSVEAPRRPPPAPAGPPSAPAQGEG